MGHKRYWLVFGISLLINFLSINRQSIPTSWNNPYDSPSYISTAKQIVDHQWPDFSFRTPTYPIFLSLFTSKDIVWSVYASAILGAIGIVLVLVIVEELISSKLWSFLITIFIAFDLGVTNYQSIILTESIAPVLVLFSIVSNLYLTKSRKVSPATIVAVLVSDWLVMFLKPTFIFLPLLLKVVYFASTFLLPKIISSKNRKCLLWLGAANVIFVFLFVGYNYFKSGEVIISGVERYNKLGKAMSYGYLDRADYYQNPPEEVLKAIEIYNKNSKPYDPYVVANNLETSAVDKVNKYVFEKNKVNFFVRTIFLIPNNLNAHSEIYVQRNEAASNNPIFKIVDYIYRIIGRSKLYILVLAMVALVNMLRKNDKRSVVLGSMLLWSLLVIIAISIFGFGEPGRLRQPVDLLFDIFLFIPVFYLFQNK